MLLNSGRDLIADALADTTGFTGTSTAISATSLTHAAQTWTTDQWKGHVVVTGSAYGVVTSNDNTVLTIDKWYVPPTPGGAAATTPSTGVYVIVAGNQPAFWLALTADANGALATHTTLAAELTTNGFSRKVAAYGHTDGQATYTLTAPFTCSGGTTTINMIGVFNQSAGGRMVFETVVSSAPTLISGDQLTVTDTVTISSV